MCLVVGSKEALGLTVISIDGAKLGVKVLEDFEGAMDGSTSRVGIGLGIEIRMFGSKVGAAVTEGIIGPGLGPGAGDLEESFPVLKRISARYLR